MAKRTRKKAKSEEKAVENNGTMINEPRIFELMYLEKAITEAGLQKALQTKTYTERITQLKAELQNVVRQWDVSQRQLMRRMEEAQREIEEKHGIHIYEWGYDDITGVMQKHPPDVLAQIHAQRELQRKKNAPEESENTAGEQPDKEPPPAPVAEA